MPSREADEAEVVRHREARNRRLAEPYGWLSLVGRYALEPGENTLEIGVATFHDGEVRVRLADGVHAFIDGTQDPAPELLWPAPGSPAYTEPAPLYRIDGCRYELLRQGDRAAIRVRDPESPALRAFTGLRFFPFDPSFRVTATLERSPEPRTVTLTSGLGNDETLPCPGTLRFEHDGNVYRLDPVLESPDARRIFVLFRDETSGRETYGAGRFLYAPWPPTDDQVVLDFNQAFNPPCALTPFASCPMVPPQNHLRLAVVAGELDPGHEP